MSYFYTGHGAWGAIRAWQLTHIAIKAALLLGSYTVGSAPASAAPLRETTAVTLPINDKTDEIVMAQAVQNSLTGAGAREYSETLRAKGVETDPIFKVPKPKVPPVKEPAKISEQPAKQVPTQVESQSVTQGPKTKVSTSQPTNNNDMRQVGLNIDSPKTIVISSVGTRQIEDWVLDTLLIKPVWSAPTFSSDVNEIASVDRPVIISSRGVTPAHSGQGEFVSTSEARGITETQSTVFTPPAIDSRLALIYFDDGSTAVNDTSRNALKSCAEAFTEKGGIVRIVGHASQRTRDMSYEDHVRVNFDLSLGRAQTVGQMLVKMGVPEDSIVLVAKGSSEPEYLEIMPSGEARNRRVEVFLDQG